MAEMFSVFVETNFETRLVFLLNKDDNVSVVKGNKSHNTF